MAKCLSCSEIGGTEWYAWVVLKGFVGPKITNRWNRVRFRENTCHLSSLRLVRSHKDLQGIYWKMCKELDAENAEQTERNLDEVFFERGNKYAWDECKNTEKNIRELHLEMVGEKVTYVRVYWLRSQVRSLDHRSYSSFKLKNGVSIFRRRILMYSHLIEVLWLVSWSKASLRWNNIPWVVVLIVIM